LRHFAAISAHFTRRGGILRHFAAVSAHFPRRGGILRHFAAISAHSTRRGGILRHFAAISAHSTRRGGILRHFAAISAHFPRRGGILRRFAAAWPCAFPVRAAADNLSENGGWHGFRYLPDVPAGSGALTKEKLKEQILWEKLLESTSEQPIPASQ